MLTVPAYNINAKQREFAGHTGRVFAVDLAEDGLCVTASEDGTAKVWRLADGRLEGQLAQSESKDEVLRVAWAPRVVRDAAGASLLAVAGADGFCNLWRGDDWAAPKSIQRLDHGGDQVYGCAWSACGDAYGAWLLTAAGAAVRTWDVNAGRSIKQWSYQEPRGDQAYVFDVQPAPSEADDALRATIACAVSDGTARVHNGARARIVPEGKLLVRYSDGCEGVHTVAKLRELLRRPKPKEIAYSSTAAASVDGSDSDSDSDSESASDCGAAPRADVSGAADDGEDDDDDDDGAEDDAEDGNDDEDDAAGPMAASSASSVIVTSSSISRLSIAFRRSSPAKRTGPSPSRARTSSSSLLARS